MENGLISKTRKTLDCSLQMEGFVNSLPPFQLILNTSISLWDKIQFPVLSSKLTEENLGTSTARVGTNSFKPWWGCQNARKMAFLPPKAEPQCTLNHRMTFASSFFSLEGQSCPSLQFIMIQNICLKMLLNTFRERNIKQIYQILSQPHIRTWSLGCLCLFLRIQPVSSAIWARCNHPAQQAELTASTHISESC